MMEKVQEVSNPVTVSSSSSSKSVRTGELMYVKIVAFLLWLTD
jgi:hypothetical protein